MTTHIKTLIALVGMIVGVVVSEKTEYASEVGVFMLVLGVMQLVIYFFESSRWKVEGGNVKANNEVRRFSIPLACGIFCIMVFLMILRVQLSNEKTSLVCEKSCTVAVEVVTTPKIKNEYQMFGVRPDDMQDTYDIQVRAPLYPRYEVGEKLQLVGKVTPPHDAMPHDGEKTFDYAMYLRTHNLGSEMYYPKIIVSTSSGESTFTNSLTHLRGTLVNNIKSYVDAPASTLASGMLFGDDSMSQELVATFRASGISHIVVLSGFNIAILISFVLLVLLFVPLFLRVIFASVFVILFVLMVGAEASVVRATSMSFIGLLALVIGRGYVARQALLLSLIAITFYEPIHLLHDVSLHLSFLATAGIVYMSDVIHEMLNKIQSKSYKEILTTTLAAYLATLPYVMYTFGTVSLYALLTNIIVLPLVPLMMLVTFLVVLFAPVSHIVALIFGYIDTILGEVIIFVAHTVERLPFASLSVSVSFMMMCTLYALIIGTYAYNVKRYLSAKRDETLPTKSDEILSEIILY